MSGLRIIWGKVETLPWNKHYSMLYHALRTPLGTVAPAHVVEEARMTGRVCHRRIPGASPLRRAAVFMAVLMLSPFAAIVAQDSRPDFLFRPPLGSVTFHGGLAHARASSDIFSFTSEILTLERGDFSSLTFGVEYAHNLKDQIDLFGTIGFSGRDRHSEFRDLVDQDNNPIEQDTRFTRVPLLLGARLYLLPRGRTVGSHAWLPSVVAPHISAGAGVLWYSFRQTGDFVDAEDNEIFTASLESSGFAPVLHAGAGLDFALSPGLLLASEARYNLASASMSDDFAGFDKIDLSGLTATVGLKIRF